jgi:GxxExxY protein
LNRQGANGAKPEPRLGFWDSTQPPTIPNDVLGMSNCNPFFPEPSPHLDQLARRVIGASIEVHRQLGPGYPESLYERAMCIELRRSGIPFRSQVAVPVFYKGEGIGEGQLDLLIDEALVVELKAVDRWAMVHEAQVIAYLKATRLQLGLLFNFNVHLMKHGIRRVIATQHPEE